MQLSVADGSTGINKMFLTIYSLRSNFHSVKPWRSEFKCWTDMMTVLEHILQLRLNIGVYHIDTKRKTNYLKVEVFF